MRSLCIDCKARDLARFHDLTIIVYILYSCLIERRRAPEFCFLRGGGPEKVVIPLKTTQGGHFLILKDRIK